MLIYFCVVFSLSLVCFLISGKKKKKKKRDNLGVVLGFLLLLGHTDIDICCLQPRQESRHCGVFCVISPGFISDQQKSKAVVLSYWCKNSSWFSFSSSKQPPPPSKLTPFVPFFLDSRFCLNLMAGKIGKFLKLELCFHSEGSCFCPRALKHHKPVLLGLF